MADDQSIRFAPSLVDHDQVTKVVCLTNLNKVLQDVATSVDSSGIRQDQFKFFLKNHQSLARVSTCCDQQFGIPKLCIFVLIVDVRASNDGVFVCQLKVVGNSISFFS